MEKKVCNLARKVIGRRLTKDLYSLVSINTKKSLETLYSRECEKEMEKNIHFSFYLVYYLDNLANQNQIRLNT